MTWPERQNQTTTFYRYNPPFDRFAMNFSYY
jgi:hypothetical protein